MTAPEYTVEQLEEAAAASIREHDFEATIGLLKLLAMQDPDRAQTIMNAIILANEVLNDDLAHEGDDHRDAQDYEVCS